MVPGMDGVLAGVFRAHFPEVALPPDIGSVLVRVTAAAEEAWPGVVVPRQAFVAQLAGHLDRRDPVAALAATFTTDVYLAYACSVGDPCALGTLDRQHLTAVRSYLARIDSSADLADEAVQVLRTKLLTARGGEAPKIASFAGRAPLGAWLRLAGVRTARGLMRSRARDVRLDTGRADLGSNMVDPETALLKARHGAEFSAAIERALLRLSPKERTLMRLYFVDGMSLQAIGRIYHVHEATISRRLSALRGGLLDAVREELDVTAAELESLVGAVMSRLDVDIGAWRSGGR
jgi:RNA polymerase sigma-70 factor (ECF subfamily)